MNLVRNVGGQDKRGRFRLMQDARRIGGGYGEKKVAQATLDKRDKWVEEKFPR